VLTITDEGRRTVCSRSAFALAVLTASLGTLRAADSPQPAAECPRYYVILFGGVAERFHPRTAHTWATFVRTEPRPGGAAAVESFTISWMPCRLPVRPLAPLAEPGRNYGLQETLDLFDPCRSRLSMWGPYEIRECWYHEADAHKAYLDSGEVRYKLLDGVVVELPWGPLRPEVSHCVHAITRTDDALRRAANPIVSFGEPVTAQVAGAMNRAGLLVCPETTHDWLLPALGIDKCQTNRRRVGEIVLPLAP
jgi:hypothetical protein